MRSAPGLLVRLYRGGTALLEPAARPYLLRRQRRGKEDQARIGERMGLPGRGRPNGPLVWVHGASVGEGLAVLPLVEQLTRRGFFVLVTTGTLTSARILERRLPAGSLHQFVPLDIPGYVRRFLDHWMPDLVMLAESELWPNLVFEVTGRGVPLMLVNARLSQRSFDRWRRLPGFIGAMLGRTALCLAQTADDAGRITALGAPNVLVSGNVKFDVPPPPADQQSIGELAGCIGARPVWVAASIHADEEDLVLGAHRRLMDRFPDLLTIAAPRQIERGAPIAQQAATLGLVARRRSRADPIDRATQVYVADTMGEMGLLYRVSGVVFVGKSLGGGGGQNPIEPAKLGSAILHGPDIANFAEVYRALDDARGAIVVADGASLADALALLLGDGARLRAMARAAAEVVGRLGGATDRIMDAVEPYLEDILERSPQP